MLMRDANRIRQLIKDRTRKGLASALSGSGPKLVEDADALVLQETLTRFGLNSHHQRDLEVKRSEIVLPTEQQQQAVIQEVHGYAEGHLKPWRMQEIISPKYYRLEWS